MNQRNLLFHQTRLPLPKECSPAHWCKGFMSLCEVDCSLSPPAGFIAATDTADDARQTGTCKECRPNTYDGRDDPAREEGGCGTTRGDRGCGTTRGDRGCGTTWGDKGCGTTWGEGGGS